ncbi:MAG: pyrimidine-nucleoside phosphorylase [Chloroflexi bacterium RBG_13_68_17]|nr:MAG: pyrimidine-nucleoside phosphorylase [Chloroflexi bacterium RBG_13_68_17]
MRAVDLIVKKRDGGELTRAEIEFLIGGFAGGDVPDYQMAAWAMAVMLRGMTPAETLDLTLAMAHSGTVIDLKGVVPVAVDKHSTGGVGDKTTLVVEPIVAACGLPVGKMSGRGLGFSGGTLDKMESIPGFHSDLSQEAFIAQLKSVGLVLAGQTADLAPADGKLYALRDVTGTVPSIPLIASSVMSKKLAGGAQGIVLDVKVGRGAFMQTVEEAAQLARLMVDIGRRAGRRMVALISDMNQPLGCAVGNALEVREAIETLHGAGPADLREHCLHVAAHMLVLGRRADTLRAAKQMARQALDGEAAWAKFKALVEAQGGDVLFIEQPERLPQARFVLTVPSPSRGYVRQVDAREIGETVVTLGGGRSKKGEAIDHSVGVVVHFKVGDRVTKGEPLFTVHARSREDRDAAVERVLSACRFARERVEALPLFYRTIRS